MRILLALKQRGTLSAAAETLHLTQSALSHKTKNRNNDWAWRSGINKAGYWY